MPERKMSPDARRYSSGDRDPEAKAAWATYNRELKAARRSGESRRIEAPHGTRRRYHQGGCTCDKCRDANATYAREWRRNSPLTQVYNFIKERLEADEAACTSSNDVHAAYVEWCTAGEKRRSPKRASGLHRELAERGFTYDAERRCWFGVRLRS